MKLSKESRKLSRQLFKSSFTNGVLDPVKVREHTQSLIASKPRRFLEVLKDYQRLVRLAVSERHAVIESATAMSPEASADVLASLKARHGQDLTAEFRVNPELIGGLRIRLGSNLWDGSIRGRLAQLAQQLA